MTTEEYRKHPALNFSLAKHLLDSPAHFKAAQDEECEPTEAMILGTVTHALVLEGKNTLDQYALKPDGMSFATKEGKAWKAEQTKEIVSEKKALKIPYAAQAISANPYALKLLEMCPNRETPIIVEYRGVQIKALIDSHGDSMVSDFKTTADCCERSFTKTIFDRHYDLQAAWYLAALSISLNLSEPLPWYWLACELSEPFANEIYLMPDDVLANGMAKMDYVIDKYKECLASDKWDLPVHAPRQVTMQPWNVFNYDPPTKQENL